MAIRGPALPRSNYHSSYFSIASRIESPTCQPLAHGFRIAFTENGNHEPDSRLRFLEKNERIDENSAK